MLEDMTLKELKIRSQPRIETLKAMGITTIKDLLTYYPYRYEQIVPIPFEQFVDGEKVTFEARVVGEAIHRYLPKNKSMIRVKMVLKTGEELTIVIFNQDYLKIHLQDKKEVIVIGKYNAKRKEVMLSSVKLSKLDEARQITPVYSVKEGIGQKVISGYIKKALDMFDSLIVDEVPEVFRERYRLPKKLLAMHWIHLSQNAVQIEQAKRYLKYEEFLLFQVLMQSMKMEAKAIIRGQPKSFDDAEVNALISKLPYILTVDQLASLSEILADLKSNTVMFRLLQGEVGSGKTVVSMLAVYANYLAGYQSAVMAPTEILARQHYKNFSNFFKDTNIKVGLLVGSIKPFEKEYIYELVSEGEIDVLIGTHALIQDGLTFNNLGLVVTDELQRFGVEQRKLLKEKGQYVDYLSMTATPIPRTLALSLFGDMDVSTIAQMPVGRLPVITKYVSDPDYLKVIDEISDLLRMKASQCYIVCPLIDSGNRSNYNVTDVFDKVNNHINKTLPMCRVAIIHGRMSDVQKEEIMQDFVDRKIDILVSTTVIEVGIDVATANVMIILDAHMFGLSQLHQLRGRVGRSIDQGYCYLVSPSKEDTAIERMEKMEKTKDGFEVSKLDLAIRGPGDLLGLRQSGLPSFNIANIVEDEIILDVARNDAIAMLKDWGNIEYRDMRIKVERMLEEQKNIVYID